MPTVNASSNPSVSTADTGTTDPPRSRILTLLAAGHVVNHWFQTVMPASLPALRNGLGGSYADIRAFYPALRVSRAIGFAAGGLATDLLRDRKDILLLSLLWTSFFFLVQGFSTTFWMLGALLFVQGLLGGALWHPPASAVIGDKFPERMGFALGIHALVSVALAVLAPFCVGWLLARITWRTAYALQLLPGIAAAFALRLWLPALRRPARQRQNESYGRALSSGVLTNLPLIGVTAVEALQSAGVVLISTVLPRYLLTATRIGEAGFVVFLAGSALAQMVCLPIIGHISDRWGRKSTIVVALVMSGLVIVSLPLWPSGLPSLVVLVCGMSLFPVTPIILASALEHTPREVWGAAQTFIYAVRSSVALIFSLISGSLADNDHPDYALYLSVGVLFAAAAAMLVVPAARKPAQT